MLHLREKRSANDNAPIGHVSNRNRLIRPHSAPFHASAQQISNHKLSAILDWLIPLAAVIACGVAFVKNIPLENLYWPSLIFGIVLLLTVIKAKARPRLQNISSLLMVLAFTTTSASILSVTGIALIGVEWLLVISIFALLTGWAFKSSPSILLSAFAGLLYLAGYFPEFGILTGISEGNSQLGAGILPWLIVGQIFLAQKVKSPIISFAAITAGYIWLIASTKTMPLEHILGLIFVVAAAHYWLSKSRAENKFFGAGIHRIFAWVVAIGAAIFIQTIWLNLDAVEAKPFGPPNLIWWIILAISAVTLFIVSFQRYKSSHISLIGAFVICTTALILPMAIAMPNLVYSALETIPGLSEQPGLGFVIGASIIAAGLYWLVSGLKSGRLLEMSMGGIVIGIQSMILIQPENFNIDLGVIFVVSLICALCVGGLVAGVTSNQQQTVDNPP